MLLFKEDPMVRYLSLFFWGRNLSYPNFAQELSFVDLLILVSRLTVLNVSYSAKQMIIQCFDQECENTQRGWQKGHFKAFLNLGSPRLASGSPGPPNNFMVK